MKDLFIISVIALLPAVALAQQPPIGAYDRNGNYKPQAPSHYYDKPPYPEQRQPTLPANRQAPDPADHLFNPLKQKPAAGPVLSAVRPQPVKCEKNILPIWIEGALHTTGQVWVCTYVDGAGPHTFYVPQYYSDDTIKFYYHDLENTGGRGVFFDPRTNTLMPPPTSTVFHTQILAREINKGGVLLPDGTPLPPNVLDLKRKGGEPWVSGDIYGKKKNTFNLPLGVMTPATKPVVGSNGISFSLLAPEASAAAVPVAPIPNTGGLGSTPPQSPADIFNRNIPFAGGFSIHVNLLTVNWRSGPPEPMVSNDGKALVFPMGFKSVPFAVVITDADKNHTYEAHIILFEFLDSEKGKSDSLKDWSKVKFVKEFTSYEDFIKYVNTLPKPKNVE